MYDYKLIDNSSAKQYEIEIEGQIARIKYVKDRGKIYLTHTNVPKNLEGKGIGTYLLEKVLEDVKKQELSIGSLPQCSFITAYIRHHPNWED